MPVNTTAQGNISISSINTENSSTTSNSLKTLSDTATSGTDPADGAPYAMSEFSGYSHASFNGSGAGNSTFSFTTGVKPTTNGHPLFDMNINGSDKASGFWEITHRKVNNNSPQVQANASGAIRIGRDITNNRILILLLKDGDNDNQSGNNGNAGYKILPYVGLGSATWTFKFEYDTTDSQYNSTTDAPTVFRGNPTNIGTATTDTTYFSVPSNHNTFQSIPSFTGMAENGESLFADGSSTLLNWVATVPSGENNIAVSVGRDAFHTNSNSIPCRLVIKAVNGSDTYTATSNYWDIGLTAQRGTGF